MLFNSYIFLFAFLPITLLGYYFIGKSGRPRLLAVWLILASLVFYAWAGPYYLLLVSGSIVVNYAFGMLLTRRADHRTLILSFGVAANILLLGYFKYANFFLDTVNTVFRSNVHLAVIVLPVAISFFTLTQITYLVDIFRGQRQEHGFLDYCLFVTFFPKLLAGPIVRMKEIMPQIGGRLKPLFSSQNFGIGLTVIALGLFKKVILADHIAAYANPVFAAAAQGSGVSFFNAWSGALAYTAQLYFDFSAYSDIAIGLGLIFNIKLPLNFYSPYKSKSIIEFWRRWHMTLGSFIRDYIYIPLGGNRHGFLRQAIYLLIALTVAGLWHGAGWTFVIWGAMHGAYLVINHAWRHLKNALGWAQSEEKGTWWGGAFSTFITFLAVTIAWVFFRADSLHSAVVMLKGMVGAYGFHLPMPFYASMGPVGHLLQQMGVRFDILGGLAGFSRLAIAWVAVSLFIVWWLPGVQEFMSGYKPALESYRWEVKERGLARLKWRPNWGGALFVGVIAAIAVLGLNQVTNFIYFKF